MSLPLESYRLMEALLDTTLENDVGPALTTTVGTLAPRGCPRPSGPPIALPTPSSTGLPLESVLRTRRSIRQWAPAPIGLDAVGTMLRAATVADASPGRLGHGASASLDLLLLAWRVEGLEPAFYLYDAVDHTVGRVGSAPTGREALDLVMQEEFAGAAALILILGDLAEAVRVHGSHGYRILLTRAGAAAYGACLASMSLQLVGCVFAGLLAGEVETRTGADGYTCAPLFAFATGVSTGETLNGGGRS